MNPRSIPTRASYRPVKELPFELRQHCAIFLEEQLYCQSLNLLSSLLTAGAVSSSPAFVPPPEFLALAATLVVHPSTTTRAKPNEGQQAANTALKLLRLVKSSVGPLGADFAAAFTFTHFTTSRSGARRQIDFGLDGSSNDGEPLSNIELAQRGSLFSRAEDFWHVVGWAFNCAILHPNRWPRWKLLLEFMCEVLEADWEERVRLVEELPGAERLARGGKRQTILCGSIIYRYFKSTSGVSSRDRRMMRAIFADGTPSATNEFREIFHNELKELEKDKEEFKKREVNVNVDEEIYGDYLEWDMDEEEKEDSVPGQELPTRPKRQRTTRGNPSGSTDVDKNYDLLNVSHSDNLNLLGDLDALSLRQRLLAILSAVSAAIPEDFMHIDELYHLYVDFIRHLPLPIFQLFVSPSVLLDLPADAQCTLCEMLLERLRENKLFISDEPYLNQHKLERYFLPYAASTSDVIDNARVSILLESVVRLLAGNGVLRATPSLKEAVEKGIMKRANKAQTDKTKNQSKLKAVEFGWTWLIESGERLTYLVEKAIVSIERSPSAEQLHQELAVMEDNCEGAQTVL